MFSRNGSHRDVLRKAIKIDHVMIQSRRSFDETVEALRSKLPAVDLGALADQLRKAPSRLAAQSVLAALPRLGILSAPRDFSKLLSVAGRPGARLMQFEIGNPQTAAGMAYHALGAALYTPVRVILRETAEGPATFEYDGPASVLGQFGAAAINATAAQLQHDIHELLLNASGIDRSETEAEREAKSMSKL